MSLLTFVCKNVDFVFSPVFFLRPVYAFFLHIERNHGHTTLKRSNHINFLSDPYIKNHDLCHIDFENNDILSCNQTIVGGSQVECFEGSQVFHPLTRRFARTQVQLKIFNININIDDKHKYKFFTCRLARTQVQLKYSPLIFIQPNQLCLLPITTTREQSSNQNSMRPIQSSAKNSESESSPSISRSI